MEKKQQYKIAIILESIAAKAGIERAVTNLSNILSMDGNQVTLISLYSDNGDKSYYNLEKSVDIIHLHLNRSNSFSRYISYVQLGIIGRKLIRECKFDYVIGTTHALNCIITSFGKLTKTIGCEHFNYESCANSSKRLRKKIYPKLNAVVLLTESDARHYDFIDRKKVFVIPNAVSFTCDIPASLDKKKIIAAGRLTYQKGFDMLIQAASIMKETIPDWKIIIFGNGNDDKKLSEQIYDLNIGDFIQIHSNTSDIKSEMLDSSIYVMSSRFEGLPMVLIEAQTCGLPIVSFNCPEGPSEIVSDGRNGYLVKPGDVIALAEKVSELAKDADRRHLFGENAYQSAKRFENDKILDKWNSLLRILDEDK